MKSRLDSAPFPAIRSVSSMKRDEPARVRLRERVFRRLTHCFKHRSSGPIAGIAIAAALVPIASRDAHAGGLYFSDRGVRPMSRGGAFVAGADDLGATWYNPAGIADAGTSVLVDFTWLRFSVEYTRELLVVDPDQTLRRFTSDTVHGNSPVLPLPTIAGSYSFGKDKQWTIAGGVLAPYVALTNYPETINGRPSPARYAMGSFNGSLMAIPGVWAAWKPIEELRLGAGILALTGVFQTTVTFSASPQDRLLGAPEQSEFDASAQLSAGPIFAPSLSGGAIFVPASAIRFGLSGQLPMVVSAPAKLKMKLPSSSVFDSATQNGEDVHVRFTLPAIVRAGIEVRPIETLRVEAAYVREFWSSHQAIDIENRNISLDGIVGMPPKVHIPDIAFPRGFQDSNSYRLGAELRYAIGEYPLDLRAGFNYETSAVPAEYLSLSSLDFDKVTIAFGGSLYVGKHWRFDGLYAHLFASSVYTTPEEALIPRVNPIKGNATFEPVNGGRYSASADLIGVGLNYRF
jgi:long-chain fatty acid transport protein